MSSNQRIDRLLRNSRLQKYEIDKLCPPVLFLVFLMLRLMPIIPNPRIHFIYISHLKKPDRNAVRFVCASYSAAASAFWLASQSAS